MLDQNTDRMWYVIGAVIIGAAIILLLNNTFPQLFASVGDTFKDKTEQTTEIVDGISPKPIGILLGPDDLSLYGDISLVSYDDSSHMWELKVTDGVLGGRVKGFKVNPDRQYVPWGYQFTLTYDLWIPKDTENIDVHTDVNNYLTGKDASNSSDNDNDVVAERTLNGQLFGGYEVVYITPDTGKWVQIKTTYVNSRIDRNPNKEDLYDTSLFGIRNGSESPVTIKIKNVRTNLTKR